MSMLKKCSVSLVLSCALSVSVFAADVKQAQEAFDTAIVVYKKGDFSAAYKMFNELYEQKSDDPAVNFYLGKCAAELGLNDEALLAYERVLVVNPADVKTRVEIARVYLKEKSTESAELELQKALDYNVSEADRAGINKLLEVIKLSKQKHFISGAMIVGFNYDTNVKNSVTNVPAELSGTSTELAKMDYSLNEVLAVTHKYRIDNSDLTWVNNVLLYNANYRQAVDVNLFYAQISSGIGYKHGSLDLSLAPTLEKLKYGFGLPDTMSAIGISQKASYALDATTSLEQSLSMKNQYFYHDSCDGMDSTVLDFSFGAKKAIDNSGKVVGVTCVLTKNISKQKDIRTDIDQSSKALKFDYSMPVLGMFDLATNFTVKRTGYQEVSGSPTYDYRRSDLTRSLGVTLSKSLDKTTMVSCGATRLFNSSNYGAFVYPKTTLNASLIKTF